MILLLYAICGAILPWIDSKFYDGFILRFTPVFPLALLLYFNLPRYIPFISNKLIILVMALITNLHFQYLIVENNYHEYYLIGFMVMIGLALSAFNSLSHIGIFAFSSFFWYFFAIKTQLAVGARIHFWAGMLVCLTVGNFGYFVAKMSLLIDRKNKLAQLNEKLNELVHTQEKLIEKESQAINASQLASLSDMAGGIAHEINNPLTVIMGQAKVLKRNIENNSLDHEFALASLNKIQSTSKRIERIIMALAIMTSNESNNSEQRKDLNEILLIVLEVCREKTHSLGIDIRFSEQELKSVTFDCPANDLTKVLLSLIFNSIDAIAKSESPWIEIKLVKNIKRNNEDEIQLRITDSGTKIPQPIAEKMFNPFFSTKPIGQGIGLGLSISYNLIAHCGASLWYDKKSAETSFVISFPKKLVKPN
jgi:signal transduction histidine kinase